jgi:hypothetical protein
MTWTINTGEGWNVIWANNTFQPPSSPQDYGEDDGLAGVREPRRPGPQPPCLVAAREPDGTWYVPLATATGQTTAMWEQSSPK